MPVTVHLHITTQSTLTTVAREYLCALWFVQNVQISAQACANVRQKAEADETKVLQNSLKRYPPPPYSMCPIEHFLQRENNPAA